MYSDYINTQDWSHDPNPELVYPRLIYNIFLLYILTLLISIRDEVTQN